MWWLLLDCVYIICRWKWQPRRAVNPAPLGRVKKIKSEMRECLNATFVWTRHVMLWSACAATCFGKSHGCLWRSWQLKLKSLTSPTFALINILTCWLSNFNLQNKLAIIRNILISNEVRHYSWPCLHQWLDTRPNRQVCPVCKAVISKDKVIPLYGRGSGKQEDPR